MKPYFRTLKVYGPGFDWSYEDFRTKTGFSKRLKALREAGIRFEIVT